ncbi:uncharacterized protein C11orf16 homolog isoform X5 [Mustela erminea]|uniref:uncharacterized protein C11orf16 homolog isoform X5 n=1 Tax=Mustela erminea TaxID=36723 RepID=UPI0013875290|nr:uncharacterized protein C11orf16 homolog isoform X5 [Mustela erminea]
MRASHLFQQWGSLSSGELRLRGPFSPVLPIRFYREKPPAPLPHASQAPIPHSVHMLSTFSALRSAGLKPWQPAWQPGVSWAEALRSNCQKGKAEVEEFGAVLERWGALLVEFEVPLITDPKLPAQRQNVVLEDDVIQFLPSVECSLRPGDKVLALCEPDEQRYGPGTVLLASEARDPQRASKGEINVHFWNGKTATVPRGGVRWVPSAVWKKAVERLHKPFTTEPPSTLLQAPCCCLLGQATGGFSNGLFLGTPSLCLPCVPQACCQLLCQGCLCSCPLAGPTWWPLARASGVTAKEHPEVELKPMAQHLPLDSPREEEGAVQAPLGVSSSSSSSEEDLENDLQMGLPQRLKVDSTVNTDPILLEKSPRRKGGLCQPEWRYWRRNRSESHPGKPGTRHGSIWREKRDNKQPRVQSVVLENTKELVLEASGMKPPRILPEDGEHRKWSQGTVTQQKDGLRLKAQSSQEGKRAVVITT